MQRDTISPTYFKRRHILDCTKDVPRQFHDVVAGEDQHLSLLGQVLQHGRVPESFVGAVDHILQAIVVGGLAATAFALEFRPTITGHYGGNDDGDDDDNGEECGEL